MIFADLELSRRLERAEAQAGKEFAKARALLQPESKGTWMEHGGAVAVFDGPQSPVTQTFCLGLFEDTTPAILDVLEQFFFDRGAPATHEVSPLAGFAAMDLLCARGYRPVELSSVMWQPVRSVDIQLARSIAVRVALPEDASLWASLSAKGWGSEDPAMEELVYEFGKVGFARANTVNFLAEFRGTAAATGSLCLHQDVALFGGASTVPELRYRGLQSALLFARMAYAAEQAYDLAMMVTASGSQSQRNAERNGFRIAYTRIKWQLWHPA